MAWILPFLSRGSVPPRPPSLQPPTNWPLTKTWGTLVLPVFERSSSLIAPSTSTYLRTVMGRDADSLEVDRILLQPGDRLLAERAPRRREDDDIVRIDFSLRTHSFFSPFFAPKENEKTYLGFKKIA